MMLLQNVLNLTKTLPNTVMSAVTTSIVVRRIRKLPSQSTDFQSLTKNTTVSSESCLPPISSISQRIHMVDTAQTVNHQDDLQQHGDKSEVGIRTHDGEHSYVPTFNLAAYVDKSQTLQQLINMGVDLSRIERRKGLAEFVLKLDFEQHIRPYLLWLKDQGVLAESFGELITKNPLLFKVEMDDLQTRINYLESKKFTPRQVQRILTLNPYWLMFSTHRIDRRLGHFQKEFRLSGDDVRFLAAKQPRLITYNMEHIRKSTFCIREEMGFDAAELKCLLLSKPRLWLMQSDELVERFAYAHKEMQLSHDMLIQCPEVLTSRAFRLKQRHEFLKILGRAQYDPEKDLYISPKAVVEGNDYYFSKNVAKSDMNTFEMFLRTR